MTSICGDSIRVAHPLFQTEGGGSTPTSPLQLHVGAISLDLAVTLNSLWHSRLPVVNVSNVQRTRHLECFGAEFGNCWYAAAIWTNPISPTFAHHPFLELRRFAIAPDAPKNTASRLLRIMARLLKVRLPNIEKFISYQDTEVHAGTIYAAAGWRPIGFTKGGVNTWARSHRSRADDQARGDKVRWELAA